MVVLIITRLILKIASGLFLFALPFVGVSFAVAESFSDGWGILHARSAGINEPLVIGLIDSERGLFAPLTPSTIFQRDAFTTHDDFRVAPNHRYILSQPEQSPNWQIYHPSTYQISESFVYLYFDSMPLWSPNSQYIFVAGKTFHNDQENEGVYLYKIGDGGIMDVTTILEEEGWNNNFQPFGQTAVWSADSTEVIFVDYVLSEYRDMALYDVTTGELEIIATHPDIYTRYDNLVLLPGGDEVAYMVSANQTGVSGMVNIRDGSSRSYNVPLVPYNVVMSPDGAFYASAQGRKIEVRQYGETTLYNAEVDTIISGEVVQWSPDGEEIAFVGWLDNQIYVVNRDGSGLRQVTSDAFDYMMVQ